MSNITLYNIPGINRVDTPSFSDATVQRLFFNSYTHLLVEDDSFYVPKFKDEIRLSTDDVSFSSVYNYVSIYYNNRYYYYFIDYVRYISETDLVIGISIDVIQTYLFSINVISGEVVRKSIKRWVRDSSNNLVINRDYIRENLSEGLFKLKEYKVYNKPNDFSEQNNSTFASDVTTGTIIFKSSAAIGGTRDIDDACSYTFGDKSFVVRSAYSHYILPIRDGDFKTDASYEDVIGQAQTITVDERYSLWYMINHFPTITDVYYLPFAPVQNIRTANPKRAYYESSSLNLTSLGVSNAYVITPKADSYLSMMVYSDYYSFGFRYNSLPVVGFDKDLVPALLDENYIRVNFGENSSQCTYPTSRLINNNFYCHYFGNIFDGTRNYYISASNDVDITEGSKKGFSYLDPFMCSVQAQSPARLDILTSEYATYMTYNKGALIGALVSTAGGAFGSFVQGQNTGAAIEAFTTEKVALNAGNERGVGMVKASGAYQSRINDINTGKSMASSAGGLVNWAQGALNAAMKPDNPRQIGNMSSDRLSNSITVSRSIYEVYDLDEVAKRYEGSGYRVCEVYSGNIRKFNNRLYYDVIKFDRINLVLTDCIQDLDTMGLIYDRLREGLRLWHTVGVQSGIVLAGVPYGASYSIGELFKYDNVEVDNI